MSHFSCDQNQSRQGVTSGRNRKKIFKIEFFNFKKKKFFYIFTVDSDLFTNSENLRRKR